MNDLRIATGALLLACALAFPPLVRAVLVALVWLLPTVVPSMFTPATESRWRVWRRFQPYAVLFILLSVAIQGWFGPDPTINASFFSYSVSGMEAGLDTALRAILLLSTVLVVLLPLKPLQLADILARLRLPVGVPVAILLSLQLIEDMPRTIRRTRSAQRSRGLTFDGSFLSRLLALRNLVTPVIVRTLEGSLERATALQLRGLTDPIIPHAEGPSHSRLVSALYVLATIVFVYWILTWAGLFT